MGTVCLEVSVHFVSAQVHMLCSPQATTRDDVAFGKQLKQVQRTNHNTSVKSKSQHKCKWFRLALWFTEFSGWPTKRIGSHAGLMLQPETSFWQFYLDEKNRWTTAQQKLLQTRSKWRFRQMTQPESRKGREKGRIIYINPNCAIKVHSMRCLSPPVFSITSIRQIKRYVMFCDIFGCGATYNEKGIHHRAWNKKTGENQSFICASLNRPQSVQPKIINCRFCILN